MTKVSTARSAAVPRALLRQIKRLSVAFRTQMDAHLAPFGLTTAQVHLLHSIKAAPSAPGAQLARACSITPQSAQAILEKLTRTGHIRRGKDASNHRLVTFSLTAKGEKALATTEDIVQKIERRLWQGVPKSALEQMSKLLSRAITNIESGS